MIQLLLVRFSYLVVLHNQKTLNHYMKTLTKYSTRELTEEIAAMAIERYENKIKETYTLEKAEDAIEIISDEKSQDE